MCKKSSVTKDPNLSIHYLGWPAPLPMLSLPVSSVTKVQARALRYLVPISFIYCSFVYSLFPSKKFSYRAYLRGGTYTRSETFAREMVA